MPNQLRGGSLRRRGGAPELRDVTTATRSIMTPARTPALRRRAKTGCRTKAKRRSTAVVRVTLVVRFAGGPLRTAARPATGPSQAQCTNAYAGGTLAGVVTVTDGIQRVTVARSGDYRIEVWGAEGGDHGRYGVGGKLGAARPR